MSPPKDLIRLQHMLDYAREAMELMQGKGRNDLDSDRLLGLALVRLLEMIGEGGGYIAAPSHSIPRDAKVENVAAMIQILQDQ